ncbi:MAG TPA: YbhN family protein [Thermohalobaculum sp.]|nr:YbhN family protein [Thermohalobaculum sp.]
MAVAMTRFKTAVLSRLKQISPYFIAMALFSGGLYALHRLLAPVHLRDVMLEVHSTPTSSLAIALLATAGAYAALIGYDWSALRYIGKRLPLRVIALGGFLGYSIGNTMGLNALTGGAVRYRIYSALGLDAYDVAAIAVFASASFGFGATIIGLGSLALHPDAL